MQHGNNSFGLLSNIDILDLAIADFYGNYLASKDSDSYSKKIHLAIKNFIGLITQEKLLPRPMRKYIINMLVSPQSELMFQSLKINMPLSITKTHFVNNWLALFDKANDWRTVNKDVITGSLSEKTDREKMQTLNRFKHDYADTRDHLYGELNPKLGIIYKRSLQLRLAKDSLNQVKIMQNRVIDTRSAPHLGLLTIFLTLGTFLTLVTSILPDTKDPSLSDAILLIRIVAAVILIFGLPLYGYLACRLCPQATNTCLKNDFVKPLSSIALNTYSSIERCLMSRDPSNSQTAERLEWWLEKLNTRPNNPNQSLSIAQRSGQSLFGETKHPDTEQQRDSSERERLVRSDSFHDFGTFRDIETGRGREITVHNMEAHDMEAHDMEVRRPCTIL